MSGTCGTAAFLLAPQPTQTFVSWLPIRPRCNTLGVRNRGRITAVFQPHTHYGRSEKSEAVDVGQSDRRNLQWRRMPAMRPTGKLGVHFCPKRIQDARSHSIVCAIGPDVHDAILAIPIPRTSGAQQ